MIIGLGLLTSSTYFFSIPEKRLVREAKELDKAYKLKVFGID
jgi:hypothetical protein